MKANVNRKRRYSSARREEQAAATRESVLEAARAAFIAGGWQKTTIAGIASKAGVSSETIYAVFGSKRALLQALFGSAIRGSDPQTPLLKQAGPTAVASASSQQEQIDLFSRDITNVLNRVAPLMGVVRAAAEADSELAELYANLHKARRRNLEFFVDALLSRGRLKPGLDRDDAVTTVWRIVSPELFLLVTTEEGTEPTAFSNWLNATLKDLLLAPDTKSHL